MASVIVTFLMQVMRLANCQASKNATNSKPQDCSKNTQVRKSGQSSTTSTCHLPQGESAETHAERTDTSTQNWLR